MAKPKNCPRCDSTDLEVEELARIHHNLPAGVDALCNDCGYSWSCQDTIGCSATDSFEEDPLAPEDEPEPEVDGRTVWFDRRHRDKKTEKHRTVGGEGVVAKVKRTRK